MKKNALILAVAILASWSCSEDQNPTSGEFYVQATITPPVDGQRWIISNDDFSVTTTTGSTMKSDPLTVNAKDNIWVATGIIDATEGCHTITLDFYYGGKSFDSRTYQMGGFMGIAFSPFECKDGYEQKANVIIPG